ncbi:MAG: hypothetical protein IJZ26_03905 [Clostridia bacterium]|nr:hypothetical protein [Clostridia bacterium]
MENLILNEFVNIMNINPSKIEEIRFKDGVYVGRVFVDKTTYIIKYFQKAEYRREIENYKVLQGLGIKTLKTFGFSECAIVMEDVLNSDKLRLATADDLKNPEIIKNIAVWYKSLHTKGSNVKLKNAYCESDMINKENIIRLSDILSEDKKFIVDIILNKLAIIDKYKNELKYTLNYNDFSFDNLIIGDNCVFMYDYNLLGNGYVYADIRNVCSALNEDMKKVFKDAYNIEQDLSKEKLIDSIVGCLFALISASFKETFPKWAESSKEYLESEKFIDKLNLLN